MAEIPKTLHWDSFVAPPGTWGRIENTAIAHDSHGNVYVAGFAVEPMETTLRYINRYDGQGRATQGPGGTFPWYSAATPYLDWCELSACAMAIDESQNQLYVLVRARLQIAPQSPHFFLYAHDLTSGARLWHHSVGWSRDQDGHMDLDGSGNVWVAITDGGFLDLIRLTAFSPGGEGVALQYDGLLGTSKRRRLFGFGARKGADSLYVAYREEDPATNTVDELVVARYSHDIAFLGRTPVDIGFQPPNDINGLVGPPDDPEFHAGYVAADDGFVVGGFVGAVRQMLYPENFGTFRILYPLILGFDTEGVERFRHVDQSTLVSSRFIDPVGAFDYTPVEWQLREPRCRAVLAGGAGDEVLYGVPPINSVLSLRSDGTVTDEETVFRGHDREYVEGREHLVVSLPRDITYVSPNGRGAHHLVRAGVAVLVEPPAFTNMHCRPALEAFHHGLGTPLDPSILEQPRPVLSGDLRPAAPIPVPG